MKKIYILLIAIFIGNIANAQNWQVVGPDELNQASYSKVDYSSIAIDGSGTPYVFFSDNANGGKASLRKYVGNNWSYVGTPFLSSGFANFTSLAINSSGTPYVIFTVGSNNDTAKVLKFDGINWIDLGILDSNIVIVPKYTTIAIDSSGTPYIAYSDIALNYKVTVKKFNGNSWVNVGTSGFSTAYAVNTKITIDRSGTPYVVFSNGSSLSPQSITVMKFNGSSWVNVGNSGFGILKPFSTQEIFYIGIAIDKNGNPYVIYGDYNYGNRAQVKKYDGSSWVNVGNIYGISNVSATHPSIAIDSSSTPYITYCETINNPYTPSVVVKKFNGSNWLDVGSNVLKFTGAYSSIAIDGSGTPYIGYTAQTVSVKKYNGNSWIYLGNPDISDSLGSNSSIAINKSSTPYIIYKDVTNQNATVKKFNGTSWITVGNSGLANCNIYGKKPIVFDSTGNPYVAYIYNFFGIGKVNVKKFDGSNWVYVGNVNFASGNANDISIAISGSGTPYIVYEDITNGHNATVMKFNGSNWVTVGNPGISTNGAQQISIDIDNNGTPYVAFVNSNNKLSVKKFNGSSWVYVGIPDFSLNMVDKPLIKIDAYGTPYVIFCDIVNLYRTSVMKYNGNSWINVGVAGFTPSSLNNFDLAFDNNGTPYVVYINTFKGKVNLMKFNGSSWVNVGNPEFNPGYVNEISIDFDSCNYPYIVYNNSGKIWSYKFVQCINPTNGGVITANQSICLGATPVILSNTQNSSGFMGSLVYKWQKSTISDTSGFIDIAGATSLTYQPTSLNANTWFRRLANVACSNNWIDSAAISNVIKIKVDSFPVTATAAAISGSTTVCQGQTNVAYTVPAIANASSYIWSLPTGATTTNTTDNISVNYSSLAVSGNITVKGHSGCGDGGSSSLAITVSPLPNSADTITGLNSVCPGQSSVTYSIPAIPNATSYMWTLPAGATGTSTTNTITVNYDTSVVSGNISVFGVNSCGNGASLIKAITVKPLLVATGPITGSTTVCQMNNYLYTIPAIANATSYIWTLPNGVTGTSTTNSIIANYSSSAVSGNISAYGVNSCGNAASSTLSITVNPVPDAASSITGLTSVCMGQNSVTYSIPPIANATSYVWTIPYVATGNSSTNTITVNYVASAGSVNFTVKGNNSCGNGASSSLAINVNSLPYSASAITGLTSVCPGQTSVTYSVPLIANATSYIWTLPNGVTGTSTTNSIIVNYSSSAVSGNISVYGVNSCGNGTPSNKTITVSLTLFPDAAGTISGATSVCQGQTSVTHTVPAINNAISYIWALPTGATGSSTTNTITVNYGTSATSGNITVKGSNACGIGDSSILAVTVNVLPGAAGIISGISIVCQGQTSATYTVPAIANATSYIWSLPVGATGTSTTNTITVNYGTSAVSGNITVKGNNSCGDGVSSSLAVTVNPLPAAAATITGLTSVCKGQTSVNYSIPNINNATSYYWSLPAGAIGTSTSNTITVNYDTSAVSGNIAVYGVNLCGNGSPSNLTVTVNSLPQAAATITGLTNVYAGQTSVTYTIPAISNATSYSWTLLNGATGTSTTNSIIVNYSSSAVSGNITVKGTNSCGDGSIALLYVTVNPYSPNCSAQFTLVADTAVLHHYFIVNNASGVAPLHYNWSWGDGTHDTTAYPAHTYSAAGYYKICLTIIDSVGCTTTYCDSSYLQKDPNAIISVQVIPQGTLGINSLSSDKIKIYPNPAKDNLIIELSESKDLQNNTITIYNIAGQLIKQLSTKQAKTEIDIHSFAAGVYIVKVNNDKETLQGKFVKE